MDEIDEAINDEFDARIAAGVTPLEALKQIKAEILEILNELEADYD